MSTHNLCFEQKYEKISEFLSENFQFLVVKFSIYLNRHVFVMNSLDGTLHMPRMIGICTVCACLKALFSLDAAYIVDVTVITLSTVTEKPTQTNNVDPDHIP